MAVMHEISDVFIYRDIAWVELEKRGFEFGSREGAAAAEGTIGLFAGETLGREIDVLLLPGLNGTDFSDYLDTHC